MMECSRRTLVQLTQCWQLRIILGEFNSMLKQILGLAEFRQFQPSLGKFTQACTANGSLGMPRDAIATHVHVPIQYHFPIRYLCVLRCASLPRKSIKFVTNYSSQNNHTKVRIRMITNKKKIFIFFFFFLPVFIFIEVIHVFREKEKT